MKGKMFEVDIFERGRKKGMKNVNILN